MPDNERTRFIDGLARQAAYDWTSEDDSAYVGQHAHKKKDYEFMLRHAYGFGDAEVKRFKGTYFKANRQREKEAEFQKDVEYYKSRPGGAVGRAAAAAIFNVAGSLGALAVRPFSSSLSDAMIEAKQRTSEAYTQASKEAPSILPDAIVRHLPGVMESLGTSALLGGLGGEATIIAGHAGLRGNEAISEANKAGLEGWNKWRYVGTAAAIEGGITAAFSKLGAGGLEKVMGGGFRMTGAGIGTALKRAGISYAQELPEEMLVEMADMFNQRMSGVDPEELTWDRAFDSLKEVAIATAMTVGLASGTKSIMAQGDMRRNDAYVKSVATSFGLSEDIVQDAVVKAQGMTKKGRSFEGALGQALEIAAFEAERPIVIAKLRNELNVGAQVLEFAYDKAVEAKVKGRNGEAVLQREVEQIYLQTPLGVNAWVDANLETAAIVAAESAPSRKMFKDANLPKLNASERKAFADNIRQIISTPMTTPTTPVEIVEDVPVEIVEDVPVEIVEDVPVEIVEDVPVEIVEDVPVEIVEGKEVEVDLGEDIDESKIVIDVEEGDTETTKKYKKEQAIRLAKQNRRLENDKLQSDEGEGKPFRIADAVGYVAGHHGVRRAVISKDMVEGKLETDAAIRKTAKMADKTDKSAFFVGLDIRGLKSLNEFLENEQTVDEKILAKFASLVHSKFKGIGADDIQLVKHGGDEWGVVVYGGKDVNSGTLAAVMAEINADVVGILDAEGVPSDLQNPRAKRPGWLPAYEDVKGWREHDKAMSQYLHARGSGFRIGIEQITSGGTLKSVWDQVAIKHHAEKEGWKDEYETRRRNRELARARGEGRGEHPEEYAEPVGEGEAVSAEGREVTGTDIPGISRLETEVGETEGTGKRPVRVDGRVGEETPSHTDKTTGNQYTIEAGSTKGIKVAPKRFQFKRKTDPTTGVKHGEGIPGAIDPAALGTMVVYEEKDGARFIVSGHHRIAKIRESGADYRVPLVVLKESEGWTDADARAFGARVNIKEGGGDIDDYAAFFRDSKITQKAARDQSLFRGEKARQGFAIGKNASDALYNAFLNNHISGSKAAAIANAAPNNPDVQQVVLDMKKGLSESELDNFTRQVVDTQKAQSKTEGTEQDSLFGDDAGSQQLFKDMIANAKVASKHAKVIRAEAAAWKGALKTGKLTPAQKKSMGVKSGDTQKIQDKIADLTRQAEAWDNFTAHPELVKQIEQEREAAEGDLFKEKPKRIPGGDAMAATAEGDSYADEEAGEKKKTADDDFAPEVEEAAAKVKLPGIVRRVLDMLGGVVEIIAPAKAGGTAQEASLIIRKRQAEAAQRDEVIRYKLNKYEKQLRKLNPDEVMTFIDCMETGQPQATPELNEAAEVFRGLLDNGRKRIQKHGKLKEFYENYFPHLFDQPEQAGGIIRQLLSKRKFKPSTFLKRRKHLTVKEAVDAGCKLAFSNPAEMVIMRLHEVNKYVAACDMMQDFKERGLAKFVPESLDQSYLPSDYEVVDDPAFTVIANPEITVEEAYDKLLVDQLQGVASQMGVSTKRTAKMRGAKWGESGPGKKIKTRFAAPVSVLAHEIGHQIGNLYGLYDYITKGEHVRGRLAKGGKEVKADAQRKRAIVKAELRALADLRAEHFGKGEVPANMKKYIRKRGEKEAMLLEAWLAAPEKMAEVAPNVTNAWKTFLENTPDLTPLLHLNRSMVLGTRKQKFDIPGVLTIGKWAMPGEAARLIKNQLSPGLRGHENAFVHGAYGGLRYLGNAMNQASLALSGFHALNVSSDAISSHIALGLTQLGRLDFTQGLKTIAGAYKAPVSDLVLGHKVMQALRTDLDKIGNPHLKLMVESVVAAGGRGSMDTMYANQAVKGLMQSLRDLKFSDPATQLKAGASLPGNILFSALELAAKPIMEMQVPRLKLGVFYHFASDIHEQAAKKGWSDSRIQTELSQAWDSVDNRMGQLAYDNLHWNRFLRDVSMLSVRSVGWNLGSIREFGGAIGDVVHTPWRMAKGGDLISRRMGYAVGSAISYAMQGFLLQYLFTGEPPEEIKDYYFPKTGRTNADGSAERLSLPTYAKDWVAWATQPILTAQHKLHPMWATIAASYSNKDYYGTKIRNEDDPFVQQLTDTAQHIGESFLPFSIKNYSRLRDTGESKPMAALMAVSGIGSAPGYITKTPAQKLMMQYLAERMPKGSRTKAQAEMTEQRRKAIREMRSGKKVNLDEFSTKQIKSIKRDAKLTHFQSAFRRLGFEEALNVFNASNTKERKQAFDMLAAKKKNASQASDDALKMFYQLDLSEAQRDTRRKADVEAAGKTLFRLGTKEKKGVAVELQNRKTRETLEQLSRNPEYKRDMKWIASVMRETAKRRGYKTNYYHRNKKPTAFGRRMMRLQKIIEGQKTP